MVPGPKGFESDPDIWPCFIPRVDFRFEIQKNLKKNYNTIEVIIKSHIYFYFFISAELHFFL